HSVTAAERAARSAGSRRVSQSSLNPVTRGSAGLARVRPPCPLPTRPTLATACDADARLLRVSPWPLAGGPCEGPPPSRSHHPVARAGRRRLRQGPELPPSAC